MNKLVIFLVLSVISFSAVSSPVFEAQYEIGRELELAISPSFADSTVYTLVTYDGKKVLAKRVFESGFQKWSGVKSESHIELNEETYKRLMTLLDDALTFKVKDDVRLEDGIIWELETSRYQWLEVRISSPEYETESRGYSGLLALGAFVQAQFP
ncbi:hypothetical protein ACJJID_11510 [Microbulbifer sp. CnH-101-G]|uniref:hypothetical protein n=1 Tax=Microbulbifer sp. CnH-101-G TaxID=3243393 RepID=UPI00403A7679